MSAKAGPVPSRSIVIAETGRRCETSEARSLRKSRKANSKCGRGVLSTQGAVAGDKSINLTRGIFFEKKP